MMKAAIFDVDGCLLDSMMIWLDAGAKYLKTLNIEAPDNLSDILWNMSIPEAAEYLKKTYALSTSLDEIVEGTVNVVRDFYYNEATLKDGAKEFLEDMKKKGIPMVIATSSDRSYLEAAFRRNDIDQYFENIFTCQEIGAGKTKPDIYLQAAGYLGFNPEEICVFEDASYAVETAKNAGFHVVAIYDSTCVEYEEEIRSISDLYMMDFTDKALFWNHITVEKG